MSTYSASAAVGEILRQPDDLLKLSAYRTKLLKEKATLDAKLASGVKDQLEATRDALLKLQSARATVGMIREEMMMVDKLKGGEESGEAFDKITRVSCLGFVYPGNGFLRRSSPSTAVGFGNHCR
jgi:exocyst complex component 3